MECGIVKNTVDSSLPQESQNESESYWGIVKTSVAMVAGGCFFMGMGVTFGATCIAAAPLCATTRGIVHTYSKLPDCIKDSVSSTASSVVNSRAVQTICYPFRIACNSSIEAVLKRLPGEGAHPIARSEKPASYPERQPVGEYQVAWELPFADYKPSYYVAPEVLESDCADPKEMPLNPKGRTGLAGRGILEKWGPNEAIHQVITRNHPETGRLEMLMLKQENAGQKELLNVLMPDNMKVAGAITREFKEGANKLQCLDNMTVLYSGYLDDPRNTDNAWVKTTSRHLHLPQEMISREAKRSVEEGELETEWVEITPELNLCTSHKNLVELAMLNFEKAYVPKPIQSQIEQFLKV